MTNTAVPKNRKPSAVHRWIRRSFLLWALISTLWLANSYRTRGVNADTLQSSSTVSVIERAGTLEFLPASSGSRAAVIFICGSGVSARAYAPLLRPIAEAGHAVFVVKLPYRFAPLESHKEAAVERVQSVIAVNPQIEHWVVSGHSLGGALACRFAHTSPTALSALVLIGTTHPKEDDLSSLTIPITKVYASKDGVAPSSRIHANKRLLPEHTKWIEIEGGNHSQFGHYGHQLLDGRATISRESQQIIARSAILEAAAEAEKKSN